MNELNTDCRRCDHPRAMHDGKGCWDMTGPTGDQDCGCPTFVGKASQPKLDHAIVNLSNRERLELIAFLQRPNGSSKQWGMYHRISADGVVGGGIMLRLSEGSIHDSDARRRRWAAERREDPRTYRQIDEDDFRRLRGLPPLDRSGEPCASEGCTEQPAPILEAVNRKGTRRVRLCARHEHDLKTQALHEGFGVRDEAGWLVRPREGTHG